MDNHLKFNIYSQILDELVKGRKPGEFFGESGLLKEMTKRLVEHALEGGLTAILGIKKFQYREKHGQIP